MTEEPKLVSKMKIGTYWKMRTRTKEPQIPQMNKEPEANPI